MVDAVRIRLPLFALRCASRDLRKRVHEEDSLAELHRRGQEIIAQLEVMLPTYTATITRHSLSHQAERIPRSGPTWTTWL